MSDCLQKCISVKNNPKSTYGHSKKGSRTSFWHKTRVRILIILKNNIFWWICLDVELLKGTPNVCSHGHAIIEETRFRKYWRSNITRWEYKYKNYSRGYSGQPLTWTTYVRSSSYLLNLGVKNTSAVLFIEFTKWPGRLFVVFFADEINRILSSLLNHNSSILLSPDIYWPNKLTWLPVYYILLVYYRT